MKSAYNHRKIILNIMVLLVILITFSDITSAVYFGKVKELEGEALMIRQFTGSGDTITKTEEVKLKPGDPIYHYPITDIRTGKNTRLEILVYTDNQDDYYGDYEGEVIGTITLEGSNMELSIDNPNYINIKTSGKYNIQLKPINHKFTISFARGFDSHFQLECENGQEVELMLEYDFQGGN